MKKHLIYDIYGNIVAYKAGSLSFASLEDVQEFLKLNKHFSIFDIKTTYVGLGIPSFVNIKATKENGGRIVYYDLEDLQLEPEENYEP